MMGHSHGHYDIPHSEPVFQFSSQEVPSSPPSIASEAGARRKPKGQPSVTPRRLRKFFTPRSKLNGNSNPGTVRTNRQALKALHSPALNRQGPAFRRTSKQNIVDDSPALLKTPSKKRKLSFSSIGSPPQSSPLRKVRIRSPIHNDDEIPVPVKDLEAVEDASNDALESKKTEEPHAPISPIRKSRALQTSGGLYMRSMLGPRAHKTTIRSNSGTGLSPATTIRIIQTHRSPDWQDLTSNFYSRPGDSHECASCAGGRLALPFCTASCNSEYHGINPLRGSVIDELSSQLACRSRRRGRRCPIAGLCQGR